MSLTYTTGNPNNLTAGATASMNDIQGPFTDIKTFLTDGAQSIGTTLLANNAVTAAKIESQQAWQTLAFSVTGLSGTIAYFKDSLGMVHFRGDIYTTSASVPNASNLGTIPAGYRPGVATQGFSCAMQGGNSGTLKITTAGVITLNGLQAVGASQEVSFGSVHYRAEN